MPSPNRPNPTPPSAPSADTISAELRFERRRTAIGLVLGPAAAVLLLLLPLPDLSREAHRLAAIIGWVIVWWVTEPIPIPVTALVGAALSIVLGIAPADTVLAPFADPTIYLFLGSFLIARAMSVHGLDRRFAYRLMAVRWAGSSAARTLFMFGAITAAVSMWISNTAATAMMFPIGVGIVHAMADRISRQTGLPVDPLRLRFGTGMMLMAAYASSAGGIGTPVGTPPNLIGIAMIDKLIGVRIPFFQWMLFALPMLAIMYVALYFMILRLHRPEIGRFEGSRAFVSEELSKFGPMTSGERNVLIAFLVAVVLWVFPGILALLTGARSPLVLAYGKRVPEGVAALIAASLLFLLPVDWKKREFTLTWKQATQIDWGTLLLFGGGLTLGNLMFQTKLAEAIGQGLLRVSGAESMWGVTFAAIWISILVSETTSNTASATMVVPVVISLAQAAGLNPLPPAIGATLGASWGFMLPVSTPPNAIVYGSGMIPITKMVRAGVLFDILGGILIWCGLRVLLPLLGMA